MKLYLHRIYFTVIYIFILFLEILTGCTSLESRPPDLALVPSDTFLVYRRQSLIGEETYTIEQRGDSLVVNSIQGENERGRISGTIAQLIMSNEFEPVFYENFRLTNDDTTNVLKVEYVDNSAKVSELFMDPISVQGTGFFPLHSAIPAGIEMMLYKYYFQQGKPNKIPTLPRGEVSIIFKKKDTRMINGEEVVLDRYTVTGINWGNRTIWLDQKNNLIAVVYANTQFRELIRKGYEEGLPLFIAGNVEEQMEKLDEYTKAVPAQFNEITAFVGGDIVTGLKDETEKNMTMLVENGIISKIGKKEEVEIPENATIIDVIGKTLIPGLWDMHAHSNQVQWAPAYLAGGITTFRDCGNEREFAIAFRDAIAKNKAMGPDVLLGGMTDGEGITGNGIIRARSPEEAVEVVEMYHNLGYNQIKSIME